jgi:hypothetical protein
VIRAEWMKFRSVRGWVVAVIVAAVAIAGFGLSGGDQGTCYGNSCAQLTGPGGEAVSDSFYFVHQALTGNGSLTVRVTSLTSTVGVPHGGTRRAAVPWAKAGIILKATLTPGSAYAAIMVTGSHGIRMQDDYTGDMAGPATHAGWLRLTRSGSTVTGYASADGTRWTRVGAVTLPGLPATVQGGLFTTSPQWTQTSLGVAAITGSPSQSTAVFDHAALTWRGGTWTGTDVGGSSGPAAGPATGYSRAGGQFTVMGSGDIGPVTYGPSGIGTTPAQTLAGAFIALIAAPYVLAVSIPVLPLGAADWLMRVTPTAAFAVEQTVVQYPQVDDVYAPAYGYFPLPPLAGFAVLCAWTAVFLTLAGLALNRRDA